MWGALSWEVSGVGWSPLRGQWKHQAMVQEAGTAPLTSARGVLCAYVGSIEQAPGRLWEQLTAAGLRQSLGAFALDCNEA